MPTARQRRSAQDASQRQQRRRQSFSVIRRLAFTNFVNGIGVSFYSPFVSYYFYTRFGQSSASIGLLFALVSITSLIPYFVGPALAARAGLVNTVVGIRVAGVVLLALLPLMPVYVFAALCYLLRMVVQRASVPLRQSFSMGVVSPEDRATVASLSNVPSQVAAAAVPPLAGRIFDTVSAVLPFELGSFFQLINAVSYYVLFRREQLPEEGVSRGTVDPSPAPNAQHGG
jgi:predicted MFS family arabinose efflux permease